MLSTWVERRFGVDAFADKEKEEERLPPLVLLHSQNGSLRDLSSIPPLSSFSSRRKTRDNYMEELRASKPVPSSVFPTPNATKVLLHHICLQVMSFSYTRYTSFSSWYAMLPISNLIGFLIQFDRGDSDDASPRNWIYISTVREFEHV